MITYFIENLETGETREVSSETLKKFEESELSISDFQKYNIYSHIT